MKKQKYICIRHTSDTDPSLADMWVRDNFTIGKSYEYAQEAVSRKDKVFQLKDNSGCKLNVPKDCFVSEQKKKNIELWMTL